MNLHIICLAAPAAYAGGAAHNILHFLKVTDRQHQCATVLSNFSASCTFFTFAKEPSLLGEEIMH